MVLVMQSDFICKVNEYIIITLFALLGSALTFFSGFGLGTILLPMFGLFFPIDLAIGLTAIVHFLNNLFKLLLTHKNINKSILKSFGIPSIITAIAGAFLLGEMSGWQALFSYSMLNHNYTVTPVKLIVAALMILFSLFELLPQLKKISFDKKYLPIGGLLSGFFGGLTGNQGALRSAFLLRCGLTKESFIATGVAIACLIDVSRITLYAQRFTQQNIFDNAGLLLCATGAAFAGALAGNQFLKKTTFTVVQNLTAVMLIVFALLLAAGII
ncbi:MAG TPA: TSUP family transporter [Bacteroidia bacterium]|nr:TSUP family transporter [Bacteroidia bacterium]HNU33280.1 TSUP family transporter [Bacteroidia bacterium]